MDAENVKALAVLYKNIYINEGSEAYAKRYKQDADYNVYPADEIVVAHILAEVYIDVSEKNISRHEGSKRQKEIFTKYNSDDLWLGLNNLSWKMEQKQEIKEAA